jgi:hypothetical protein
MHPAEFLNGLIHQDQRRGESHKLVKGHPDPADIHQRQREPDKRDKDHQRVNCRVGAHHLHDAGKDRLRLLVKPLRFAPLHAERLDDPRPMIVSCMMETMSANFCWLSRAKRRTRRPKMATE